MELTVVGGNGIKVLEGQTDASFLANAGEVNLLLEQCFSHGADAALLYDQNLPQGFFDLSSGDAGTMLQKLRNYGIRLAVVSAPGSVRLSSRFGEMLAEERQGRHFGLFETRQAALQWLHG